MGRGKIIPVFTPKPSRTEGWFDVIKQAGEESRARAAERAKIAKDACELVLMSDRPFKDKVRMLVDDLEDGYINVGDLVDTLRLILEVDP